jgi:23S rRNA (guanosine2251-2'-O)-methyltransferase
MKKSLYLIAEDVRSAHNVGSLFRTADVFGVDKIYLCGYTPTPPRKEISKTALDAQEWIAWEQQVYIGPLLKKLKAEGVYIVALEIAPGAVSLPEFKPEFPLALIVGNEITGVRPETLALADTIVQIPMVGKKESLNVSVAAGIALYQLRQSRA